MGKNWKMFLSVGAIIVLAGLGSIFAIGRSKTNSTVVQSGSGEVAGAVSNVGSDYITRLAEYLSSNSMILYGSDQSAETKQQRELFGDAASKIDYVDCDAAANSSNPDECIGQNISVYPTWVYNGNKYEGVQTLSDLAKITGFEQ